MCVKGHSDEDKVLVIVLQLGAAGGIGTGCCGSNALGGVNPKVLDLPCHGEQILHVVTFSSKRPVGSKAVI